MTPGRVWKLYMQKKVCSQLSDLGTDDKFDLGQVHSPWPLPLTEP